MAYVYIHERLDTLTTFYVGKGSNNRATSKKDRNPYWHHIVNKHGLRVKIIQNNLTNIQALNLEKFTIALLKNKYKLVNLTDGGDGGNGLSGKNHPLYGKTRTAECREKISASLKGKSSGGKAKKGMKHSEAHKKAISDGLKGKKKSLEHIQNAVKARKISSLFNPIKRKPLSEETKLKISLAQKGRKLSEAHKIALRKPKTKKVM